MSEVSVVVVRRRRSREAAERLVLEFAQSGLTRRDFCAQHGLSVAALDQYRKRFRTLEPSPTQPQPAEKRGSQRPVFVAGVENRILPVEFVRRTAPVCASVIERDRALRVELANGRCIEVAHGFDGSTLERLVVVLEKA